MPSLHNVLDPSPRGRVQPDGQGTGFGDRDGDHWGEDLRPLVQNAGGDPIYAPAPWRCLWAGWNDGTGSSRIPWHSGLGAYFDIGVWGEDRMYLFITHCESLTVRADDTGPAGALWGRLGGTGWRLGPDVDRFAEHLHLGVAQNTTRPVRISRRHSEAGWIDPVAWFARHGVDLDTTEPARTLTLAAPVSTDLGDLTMTELKEITDRLDRHTELLESIRTSVAGVHVDDAPGATNVAGALERLLILARRAGK